MTHSRRDILKGVSLGAAAGLFAPFFKQLELHAEGKELPKRFVFVMKASGIDRANLIPQGVKADIEKGAVRKELFKTDFNTHKMPEIFKPFEPIKDKLTIIQGLSGANFIGNHTAGHGLLSCMRSEKMPIAPSIDYILGKKFSTGPYPMFGFSITEGAGLGGNDVEDRYVSPNKSAIKKGLAIPYQASPKKAYMELFGSAVMSKEEVKKQVALKKSMMDFLKDDAKKVAKVIGKEERERLEGYTEALHALGVREERKAEMAEAIKKNAPKFIDKYNTKVETVRQEAQFATATAALIGGLTNVVSMSLDSIGLRYSGLGLKQTDLHKLGHGGEGDNGWSSVRARKEIDKYQLSLIAKMANKLNSIKEGNGTMLDNTMIVYVSCGGGAHHAGTSDWPFITIGNVGGKLKMGQYLQYPTYGEKGHKTNANLFMSMMDAAKVKYGDHFGQKDIKLSHIDVSGPLADLTV